MTTRLMQVATYWPELLGSFGTLLAVWGLWKNQLKIWWKGLTAKGTNRQISRGMTSVWAPFWIVCAVFALLATYIVIHPPRPKFPVAIYHNVRIFAQLPDQDWPMSADEDKSIVFRPCPHEFDVVPMLSQAAAEGWIADHVIWEQRPTCQSIFDPSLGFTFNDRHFHYRRIANGKPSAK